MSLFDKLQGNRQQKIDKEKSEGTDFLEKNKKSEGVIALPEGLQYQIIKEGTGAKPEPGATIKAHYKGGLLNGSEFDNSFKRGQPFTARINALIKGWQVILPMMPVGSTWRLWIPSDYGYGDNGAPQAGIPGGALLVFDIELIDIVS
ncbi:MAG TPA: FKBP-type peptidyl-prolyl cis-trans isomerase [Chitinophagaceae bacterium]|nr:FKBP-type peptidyl-prolyl cis-trans isomerase [Chitinophagaceae bacterium]